MVIIMQLRQDEVLSKTSSLVVVEWDISVFISNPGRPRIELSFACDNIFICGSGHKADIDHLLLLLSCFSKLFNFESEI